MTVAVRVIPCLDVDCGRVVKGVNFRGLRDAGDPVQLARFYGESGADELTFLDVSATLQGRGTTREIVRRTAEQVFIPLTVGGGVASVADACELLAVGADKVGVNSAAIKRPQLIDEIAGRFGEQVLVLSLDVRRDAAKPSGFGVTTHGGSRDAGLDALAWCGEACSRGVGEILLNSMDADGTKRGFDVELIERVRELVRVPIVASGGAGEAAHFVSPVRAGADAVLAASVFHFGVCSIAEVKGVLASAGCVVRGVPSGRGGSEVGGSAVLGADVRKGSGVDVFE